MSKNRKITTKQAIIAGAVIVIVLAAGVGAWYALGPLSTSTPVQTQTVKVGILAQLTGSAASAGQDIRNGAIKAVEYLNLMGQNHSSPNKYGLHFEYVIADTGTMEAGAVTAAFSKLAIDDKVDVVVGSWASSTNFEINLAKQYGVIYFGGGNAEQTVNIIGNKGSDYWMYASVQTRYQGYATEIQPWLNYLNQTGAYTPRYNKTWYLIEADIPWASSIVGGTPAGELEAIPGLKETMAAAGWTLTGDQKIPGQPVADYGTMLAQIRANPPDLIYFADYTVGNDIAFVNQFLENPTKSLIVGPYGPSQKEFQTDLGAKANGVVTYWVTPGGSETFVFANGGNPQAQWYINTFTDEFGYSPSATQGWDQLMFYANCLEASGGNKDAKQAIMATLDHVTYTNPVGMTARINLQTRLCYTNDPQTGKVLLPTLWTEWENATLTAIYPTDYTTGKFVTPPWF